MVRVTLGELLGFDFIEGWEPANDVEPISEAEPVKSPDSPKTDEEKQR